MSRAGHSRPSLAGKDSGSRYLLSEYTLQGESALQLLTAHSAGLSESPGALEPGASILGSVWLVAKAQQT